MFKSAKWRNEKRKIKAVFKLQFQVTQVPQLKATTLTISLVPADVGNPTVRLQKASILEGTCSWENPVYETVKLIRDLKTGRGSSKVGLLGDVLINFADYAEAAKPSTISLPLKTSSNVASGAILHVTIQNIQSSLDQRDVEAGEVTAVRLPNRSLESQLKDYDKDGKSNLSLAEDEDINKLTSDNVEHTGSFKSLLLENPVICQDDNAFTGSLMPQKRIVEAFRKNRHVDQRSNMDWSVGSASDGSMVNSASSLEENLPRGRLLAAPERSIEKLKSKISMLERQAEISELELQSLRKQIVKESKRGQDLSRQFHSMKQERDALKTEYEQLQSLLNFSDNEEVPNQFCMEAENLKVILEEIRQELNHEKDLNNTLRLQMQKIEDSNSELVLAVRDLDEILEQRNREISDLSATTKTSKKVDKAPKEVSDYDLKHKIKDLHDEIEVYRREREELKMHIEKLAMDYETLKESHDISISLRQSQMAEIKRQNECSEYLTTVKEFKLQVERLEKEIEKQELELSESSNIINELETQVKSLEKELDKQAQGFQDDLRHITLAKIEQEQRAILAEEALRKTRSNYAIEAERVQEEFRRLSEEMASKVDENEKMAMKAVTEANDLRLQRRVLEEMLQKANEELGLIKEQYEVKLQEFSNQTVLKSKQVEQMPQELKEKCIEIESFRKQEHKMGKAFSEIQKIGGQKDRLKINNGYPEEAMEQRKTSTSEQEMLEIWSKEREELKRDFFSARREAQLLQEETNALRSLKDEKETTVRTLQSGIEKLRVQYNELKHSLAEVELEKGNLRKEVLKLEGDLQKKEEAITLAEKKLQHYCEQATNPDVKQITSEDNNSALPSRDSAKEVVSEKLNLIEEASLVVEKHNANARDLDLQFAEMNSKQDGVHTATAQRYDKQLVKMKCTERKSLMQPLSLQVMIVILPKG
ncbi:hypothetical protein U1Q18_004526 [Sarracenia purpurea var. burkii]